MSKTAKFAHWNVLKLHSYGNSHFEKGGVTSLCGGWNWSKPRAYINNNPPAEL